MRIGFSYSKIPGPFGPMGSFDLRFLSRRELSRIVTAIDIAMEDESDQLDADDRDSLLGLSVALTDLLREAHLQSQSVAEVK